MVQAEMVEDALHQMVVTLSAMSAYAWPEKKVRTDKNLNIQKL